MNCPQPVPPTFFPACPFAPLPASVAGIKGNGPGWGKARFEEDSPEAPDPGRHRQVVSAHGAQSGHYPGILEKYAAVLGYLSHLLAGEKTECSAVTTRLLEEGVPIKELYTDLFKRSMYRVGELWESGRISVATEHLATAVTEGLMARLYPVLFSEKRNGKKAVVSCSANEYHQLGARMVADIFEMNGWDGLFLGANTPSEDLLRLIHETNPIVVGLSVSIYPNMPVLQRIVEMIRAEFHDVEILAGGQAFLWGGVDFCKKIPRVSHIPSLGELDHMLGNG